METREGREGEDYEGRKSVVIFKCYSLIVT